MLLFLGQNLIKKWWRVLGRYVVTFTRVQALGIDLILWYWAFLVPVLCAFIVQLSIETCTTLLPWKAHDRFLVDIGKIRCSVTRSHPLFLFYLFGFRFWEHHRISSLGNFMNEEVMHTSSSVPHICIIPHLSLVCINLQHFAAQRIERLII